MSLQNLGHTCVVGLQWGDEGKGKIVDVLLENFDVVVRYGGGANAGHTVLIGSDKFALHQLPTGVLRPNVHAVIACGAVIDPATLIGEVDNLRARGVGVDRLAVSDRAQLVMPWHRREDVLAEQAAGAEARLGTTARGIGPCYSDKVSRRWGLRVCELFDADRFRSRVAQVVAHKNAYFGALYDFRETFNADTIADEYLAFAERLNPFVADTTTLLADAMADGKRVLYEGAQGSLLDIDHGTYPFVTSSSTGVGGVASGAGVPPTSIRSVIGVLKAYSTRVGAGPFPTELHDALGDQIREAGGEYGTTTGRPRRCGWFDAVAASYTVRTSGPTRLAVLHLDTLSGFDEVKICVGYQWRDQMMNTLPAATYRLDDVTPVFETHAGWHEDVSSCRSLNALPKSARAYLSRLSELLKTPIGIVGVGPARDQTIFVEG
ncbi:MAG: adenylosuccinate synthase [Phycisphaerales bacterium]|nr:adenylosuccinate synthase [Phycisphaerales bacterium]